MSQPEAGPPLAENVTCNKGFSLVELIFAITFVTVIVLGVVRLQTSNLGLSGTNQKEIEAYFWASQGMEAINGMGYANLPACAGPMCRHYLELNGADYRLINTLPGNPIPPAPNPITPAPFSQIVILEPLGTPTNAFKTTSRVTWTDSTGAHQVEVKRIIF